VGEKASKGLKGLKQKRPVLKTAWSLRGPNRICKVSQNGTRTPYRIAYPYIHIILADPANMQLVQSVCMEIHT
jgi:hypothetical protein